MRQVARLHLVKGRGPLNAGAFLVLFHRELAVLDTLPAWYMRLFACLVRCSDYSTGAGTATYGQLVDMMKPIQPRRGPRHFVPDDWAIWRALGKLEAAELVTRAKDASQRGECIFFEIAPRSAQVRPASKLAPGTRTPPT